MMDSRKLRVFSLVCIILFASMSLGAQDPQVRVLVHPMVDLNEHWYLTIWSISNVRAKTPDNTNVMAGFGYRGKDWWLETMIQRQWNHGRNNTMIDTRFQKQWPGKALLYLEPIIFLNRKAFYEFAVLERPLWRKLNVGGETENLHQPGQDVLALGPRMSFPLVTLGQWKVNGAVSYRFRYKSDDEPRLYLGLSRRFP